MAISPQLPDVVFFSDRVGEQMSWARAVDWPCILGLIFPETLLRKPDCWSGAPNVELQEGRHGKAY